MVKELMRTIYYIQNEMDKKDRYILTFLVVLNTMLDILITIQICSGFRK